MGIGAELFEATKRWGRWGDDDERGALNLLTPERVARATALVRDGVTGLLVLDTVNLDDISDGNLMLPAAAADDRVHRGTRSLCSVGTPDASRLASLAFPDGVRDNRRPPPKIGRWLLRSLV